MRRILSLIVSLAAALTLTGCWDSVEINDRALIMMVGLDKKDGEIQIYLEDKKASSGKEGGGGEEKKTNVIVGNGEDLAALRADYMRKNKQNLYIGAIHALVVTDSFASQGIEEYINRVMAYREYRKTIRVFTTTSELEKLFDSKLLGTESVGLDLSSMGNHLYADGVMDDTRLTVINENIKEKSTGFIIPNVDVVDDKLEMNGYSVFKNAKKIGFIPYEKLLGVNFILIDTAKGNYSLVYKGVNVTFAVNMKNRSISSEYKDNQASFTVKLDIAAEILGISKWIKLDNNDYDKLTSLISEAVKDDMFEAVKQSQNEFGCDYLEMYKYFRAKYGSKFYKLDWNEVYRKALFNFKVNAKVTSANSMDYDIEAVYE